MKEFESENFYEKTLDAKLLTQRILCVCMMLVFLLCFIYELFFVEEKKIGAFVVLGVLFVVFLFVLIFSKHDRKRIKVDVPKDITYKIENGYLVTTKVAQSIQYNPYHINIQNIQSVSYTNYLIPYPSTQYMTITFNNKQSAKYTFCLTKKDFNALIQCITLENPNIRTKKNTYIMGSTQ